MTIMLVLFLFNQTCADSSWYKYGATLENTHLQNMKGKMNTTPVIKWSYVTAGLIESSPAVFDVNDDDTMDIVIGSQDYNIYCINGINGTLNWSFPTSNDVWSSSPTAIDVDNDGIVEIIVGSEDFNVYCLNGITGTSKWQFTAKNKNISSPAIADIDTNGLMEIVFSANSATFGTDSDNVYCLNGLTGMQKWVYVTRNYPNADVWMSSPALADVDDDSIMEIFIGSKDSYLYCLDAITGTRKWEYKTGNQISASPSIADINDDDTLDVVIGSYDGKIYALNARTGVIEWSYPTGNLIWASSAIADVNTDGTLEVITGNREGGTTLYCINGLTGGLTWSYSMGAEVHRSVSVADVDRDDKPEILTSTFGLNYISALNGEDGSVLWTRMLASGTQDIHDIVAADIDKDGCIELLVGTADDFALFVIDDLLNATNCGSMAVQEDKIKYVPKNVELKIVKNKIRLTVNNTMQVNIKIYDLCGKLRQNIYDGTLSEGSYTFLCNVKEKGVYFVTAYSNNLKITKKLIILF